MGNPVFTLMQHGIAPAGIPAGFGVRERSFVVSHPCPWQNSLNASWSSLRGHLAKSVAQFSERKRRRLSPFCMPANEILVAGVAKRITSSNS
eukprot:CAMPEP_0185772948 /NCGR_PEP_ID=MMETSP1174-20130828/71932_1 /TAXON_ID=35687 /ORGANISM="Dictyocha speculum, Strain CCMP1381" /LENGTH=91 /DNA_ID=CAMNT_0028459461 /DNA_START=418 /DNA_END=693 /DNA_ORIENTATION=-